VSRVVVVGSVNLDVAMSVPRLPAPGETVLGTEVAFRPGGKGGNQAVAARRLGAETVLYAAVGADQFGADLRATLDAEGLRLDGLATVDGATTGIALVVVAGDGENTIVVAPGANDLLAGGQLSTLPDVLGDRAVLALQLEIPLTTCLAAARRARRAGAMVVLNAAPLPKLMEPTFADLLANVDVLVVNEGEARQLSAAAGGAPDPPEDNGDPAGWVGVAANLRRLGPAACIITLGPRGAVVADASGTGRQPAFPVPAVDSTGAGDSFCGALAAGLAHGRPLLEAVRHGCAAGALATTRMGAQTALPTAAELDGFLRANGGR
jgi:ribokinase